MEIKFDWGDVEARGPVPDQITAMTARLKPTQACPNGIVGGTGTSRPDVRERILNLCNLANFVEAPDQCRVKENRVKGIDDLDLCTNKVTGDLA